MRLGLGLFFLCIAFLGLGQGLDLGTTTYAPLWVANLSSPYNETSGLVFINDTILSINDSGNTPSIHALRASDGAHVHSWTITNAQNQDWEALTQSPTHLFIADVGNNLGNRSSLDIYSIPKAELNTNEAILLAQKQTFKFADQPVSGLQVNAHNYDCEAVFYWHDSLHLFSKNWENLWTKHYVLPTIWQDTLLVYPVDSFEVNGLVTDATIDPSDGHFLLLGYKKELSGLYSSFMYRFLNQNNLFFAADFQRIELGSTLNLAQTEGICVSGSATGFISGEQIVSVLTIAPKLHSFNFSNLSAVSNGKSPTIYFHIHTLYIPQELLSDYKLLDTNGRIATSWVEGKNQQDLTKLKPGTYYLIGPGFRRTWVKTN
jgi:hypothetical protein